MLPQKIHCKDLTWVSLPLERHLLPRRMSLSGSPIVGTSTNESEDCCTWLYLLRGSCRTALRYSCHFLVSSELCTSETPCLRPATACCNSCSQGIADLALHAKGDPEIGLRKGPEVLFVQYRMSHAAAAGRCVLACGMHCMLQSQTLLRAVYSTVRSWTCL